MSGQDYRPPINNLRFGMCETKECFPIEIINDDLIEETESFNVTLDKSTGLSRFLNILERSRVETVLIIDNDCMCTHWTTLCVIILMIFLQWLWLALLRQPTQFQSAMPQRECVLMCSALL